MASRTSHSGTRRGRTGWAVLTLLACAVVVALTLRTEAAKAREVVRREEEARLRLGTVRDAQLAHRERTGSFGWLEDLPPVEPPPGYRLDVLLPRDRMVLTERGQGAPNPELARRHFAVVARPAEPGRSGYRSWYLDERGEYFYSEGVMDVEALLSGELPKAIVVAEQGRDKPASIFWQRYEP